MHICSGLKNAGIEFWHNVPTFLFQMSQNLEMAWRDSARQRWHTIALEIVFYEDGLVIF